MQSQKNVIAPPSHVSINNRWDCIPVYGASSPVNRIRQKNLTSRQSTRPLAIGVSHRLHGPVKHLRRNRLASIPPKSKTTRLADKLEKNPLLRIWVRINQSLALFALVVAAIGFAVAIKKFDVDEKKADEDRLAKAWDVVSRMTGKQSNGGQVSALERLNSFGISLDFVDIHNTYSAGVNLRRAQLHKANLSGANLEGADLSGANLSSTLSIFR